MKWVKSMLVILLVFAVVGCGGNALEGTADTNSDEATVVDIQEALNDGDYEDVVDELSDETNLNEQERVWLASAYLGMAGVDFINALEAVGDDADAFDVLARTLGVDQFDNESMAAKRQYLGLAFSTLYADSSEVRAAPAYCTGTADEQLIDGIAGAVDTILYIGELIIETFSSQIAAYNDSIGASCAADAPCVSLSKEWVDGLIDYYEDNVGSASTALSAEISDAEVTAVSDNMQRVECGIYVLAGDTFQDIQDEFEEFRADLCGDNNCTRDEIVNYITVELSD